MVKKPITSEIENYITTYQARAMLPKGFDLSPFQKYQARGSRKTYYLKSDIEAAIPEETKSHKDTASTVEPEETPAVAEEKPNAEGLTIIAYVDGSFDRVNDIYSSAAILTVNGEEVARKTSLGRIMSSMWNIAGEICAAALAVRMAEEFMPDRLIIRYDCEAIEMWPTGKWQAKNDYARKYSEFMNRKRNFTISYEHVKGHSGDKFNELADDIAVDALGLRKGKTPKPFTGERNRLTDEIRIIRFQTGLTCRNSIKEFYSKEKHAFKDYIYLRTEGLDNLSSYVDPAEFESFLTEDEIRYAEGELKDTKDTVNALRWTARGLKVEDAVRKAGVDKEVYSKERKKN